MAILVNKPASVSADSTTSLELNKTDLQAKLVALGAGAYWEDQSTWKGVAFLFENAFKQKIIAVFDIAAGVTADLTLSEYFVDGDLECLRIDVLGFANDFYTIYRSEFDTATEFDIEATDGYAAGGGGGGGGNPSSAIALYHFDGDANDVYGNNLTVNGSLSYVSGKFGQAVSGFSLFDYLTCDGSFFDVGSGDFTIECWAKITNVPSGGSEMIVGVNSTGSFTCAITRYYGNILIFINDAIFAQYPAPSIDDEFHHLVLQRNSGNITCFKDGVLMASGSNSFSIPTNTNLQIGCDPFNGPATSFGGAIDEVRLSNTAVYNEAGFVPPIAPFSEGGGGGSGGGGGEPGLGYVQWNQVHQNIVEADGGIYDAPAGNFSAATNDIIPAGTSGEFTFVINNLNGTPSDLAFGIGQWTSQYNPTYFGLCWLNNNLRLMIGAYVDPMNANSLVDLNGENTIRIAREGSDLKLYVNGTLFNTQPVSVGGAYGVDFTGNLVPGARTMGATQNNGIIKAYRTV